MGRKHRNASLRPRPKIPDAYELPPEPEPKTKPVLIKTEIPRRHGGYRSAFQTIRKGERAL